MDEQAAVTAISRARSAGINFFDTAQAYGFGRSERLLGRALAAEPRSARDTVVIATKGGLRMDGDLFRRDIEAGLLSYARAHHVGVLAYRALAHGLLGGSAARPGRTGGAPLPAGRAAGLRLVRAGRGQSWPGRVPAV